MNTLVKRIITSKYKIVLACAGGGCLAISELQKYGGASQTILAALSISDTHYFDSYVEFRPLKYCSSSAAQSLADAAFDDAVSCMKLSENDTSMCLGFGVSCALAKLGSERSDRIHEVNFAYKSQAGRWVWSEQWPQTVDGVKITREEEEEKLAGMILDRLAEYCDSTKPV